MSIVVGAAKVDWCREPRQTNFIPAPSRYAERLEAAPHILANHLLFASQILGAAYRLNDQRRVENGAVIETSPTLSFAVTWLLPFSTTYLRMS